MEPCTGRNVIEAAVDTALPEGSREQLKLWKPQPQITSMDIDELEGAAKPMIMLMKHSKLQSGHPSKHGQSHQCLEQLKLHSIQVVRSDLHVPVGVAVA